MLPERARGTLIWLESRPMLWLKALHVVFVVTWFAGLFYLPRLFVYHAATHDSQGLARFIVMERRLYFMMSLGALLAVLFGTLLVIASPAYLSMGWLRVKMLLVAALLGYHGWCYRLMLALRAGHRAHSQRWYRIFNEVPGILLLAIVILAVVKP
jgi:protoporphyrinogen IX oxidase